MAQALMVGPREEEVPYMGRVYKQFSLGWGGEIRGFWSRIGI